MRSAALIATFLLSFSGVVPPASGQTGNGSIQGTVQDPSGAVVVDARVEVRHQETLRQYRTATNPTGFYLVPSLPSGNYAVSISAAGMETWRGTLFLQTRQAAVVDVQMKVAAGPAAQITVTADAAPLVTTTEPVLATVVERERIDQLPLNGRLFQNLLATTTPGIEGNMWTPRVFGLREGAMEFMQDGAALSNRNIGYLTQRPPGLDTINEFRVETNSSSAKFNRPATVVVSTRSGSTKWHGSLFETARNNAFGVARRRQDFYDKPPHLVRNEFGASVSGPLNLPKLYSGHNRTFFFFAWEEYQARSSSTQSTRLVTVPMRGGDFSGLVDGAGRQFVLYDPWTTQSAPDYARLPFAGNLIPASRRSRVAAHIYNITPEPTLPHINPLLGNNYYGLAPNLQNDRTFTLRVDHRLTEKDQVFGRLSAGRKMTEGGGVRALDLTANYNEQAFRDVSAMVSWTRLISPSFFVETVITGSNEDFRFNLDAPGSDRNIAAELGLPNPWKVPGLPDLYNTGFGLTLSGVKPRADETRIITGEQNYTKIAGKHQLEFGGRYRREILDVLPDQQVGQGLHFFSGGATGLFDPASGSAMNAKPRTGHDAANFFLGAAGQYSVRFNRAWWFFRQQEYAGYLQDNWRVRPSLTLNLGVRYEYFDPVTERDNVISGFDRASKSIVLGRPVDELIRMGYTTPAVIGAFEDIGVKFITAREAGLPSGLIKPDRNDFSPRFGFAWHRRIGGRTFVVRGGYGAYHLPIPSRSYNQPMSNNPPTYLEFKQNYSNAAQTPDGKPNYMLRAVPPVVAGVNSENAVDVTKGNAPRGSFQVRYFNPDQPTTTAHQWNLTLETDAMRDTSARVGYVGTAGRNLDMVNTYNVQPNAYVWFSRTGLPLPTGTYALTAQRAFDQTTYGELWEYGKYADSNFHGVQLEIRCRYSRGIGYQLFYVLSNAMGSGSVPFGNVQARQFTTEPEIYLPGAVPTGLKERHRFLNYSRDTAIPHHRLRWNFVADLPFGKGKPLLGGATGWKQKLAGGWQLAGSGSYGSRYWALPENNWGELGNIEIYGLKYPVEDCRSGECIRGYLYYNGYIPANRINSYDPVTGKPNGVMGVPKEYRPAHRPIFPIPADGGSPTDPNYSYYETNFTWVPMKDGSLQRTGLDTGLHPWRNQYVAGPWAFGLNASLFKNVALNERFTLRFNVDFFSVLNNPGMGMPDSSTGLLLLRNSNNGPRETQLTLRLTW